MRHIGRTISITIGVLIVIVGGFLYYRYQELVPASSPVQEAAEDTMVVVPVNPQKVTNELQDKTALLLDVRTQKEIDEEGYAAGSTHIDFADIIYGTLPDIPKDTRIYVYCKGGVRAEEAKRALQDNSFTNVVNIGGLTDWEEAGGRVIK